MYNEIVKEVLKLTVNLEQLATEVAEHLLIDPVPIKYEDLGKEDSRLYFHKNYVAINEKYKDNELECLKCITHEFRHIFQAFYVHIFKDDMAKLWGEGLGSIITASDINEDNNYASQAIEIDAFAYTKFYLKEYRGLIVENKIPGMDEIIDEYIEKYYIIMKLD